MPPVIIAAEQDELLRRAAALAAQGENEQARQAYIEMLRTGCDEPQARQAKDALAALNDQILFSAELCPEAIIYTVASGDTLGAIAKRYDTTYQLIMKINGKKSSMIRVGEQLKVVPGPFDVVVKKREFVLEVYLKDMFVKSYRIGLGTNGSTPTGEFGVTSKIAKPAWFRPGGEVPYGDPENPLGTRWIGFLNEYGIHGTWEPESIGKESSRGCVRMLNIDVEDLFSLLVEEKSKVTVLP